MKFILDLKTTVYEECEFFFGKQWYRFSRCKQQKIMDLWPNTEIHGIVSAAERIHDETWFIVDYDLSERPTEPMFPARWDEEDSCFYAECDKPMTATEVKMRMDEANVLTSQIIEEAYEKLVNPPFMVSRYGYRPLDKLGGSDK